MNVPAAERCMLGACRNYVSRARERLVDTAKEREGEFDWDLTFKASGPHGFAAQEIAVITLFNAVRRAIRNARIPITSSLLRRPVLTTPGRNVRCCQLNPKSHKCACCRPSRLYRSQSLSQCWQLGIVKAFWPEAAAKADLPSSSLAFHASFITPYNHFEAASVNLSRPGPAYMSHSPHSDRATVQQ